MGLSGLSGLTGILPTLIAGFNWALMPNVPTGRRSAIEVACSSAASGQSFTASDVFSLLATAGYYFSFELGSIFTSVDTSAPATANGQSIGCARDWIQNALVSQATEGSRPTASTKGLTFSGAFNNNLVGSFAGTNDTSFTGVVIARPITDKGGAFVKVGDQTNGAGGWGLGIGSTNQDSAGLNQIALHEWVAWVPSSTLLSTSNASISTFRRGSGTTTILLNGVQTTTSSANLQTPNANFYVNGIEGRATNSEITAILLFPSTFTATQMMQINRFLNSYYTLGLTL